MTIAAALTAISGVVAAVDGVKRAPANPTENISEYPFALTYLMDGTINVGPVGTKKDLVNIAIDLLYPRSRNLKEMFEKMTPFCDTIPFALLTDVSFGGVIQTYSDVRIEFLPFYDYAGAQMIGYRFILENVKQLISL